MTKPFLPGISVVLIAHNEAARLPAWFEHTLPHVAEVIVIDSGSSDKTADIARQYTNRVESVPNRLNFDLNKNYGFSLANCEWVLSLDADEFMTPELCQEIKDTVNNDATDCVAFELLRRDYAFDLEIQRPSYHLRLFRNGAGRFPGSSVHQTIQVRGHIGRLRHPIIHRTYDTIYERVQKSNLYSESIAAHWYQTKKPFRVRELLTQPAIAFLKRYFRHSGYRQGVLGLFIAVDAAYSTFLRYFKLWSAYKTGRFAAPDDEWA